MYILHLLSFPGPWACVWPGNESNICCIATNLLVLLPDLHTETLRSAPPKASSRVEPCKPGTSACRDSEVKISEFLVFVCEVVGARSESCGYQTVLTKSSFSKGKDLSQVN